MNSEEDGPDLAVDRETPETILMNRSNSKPVQRAIEDLPVHYRETLLLYEVEELSSVPRPSRSAATRKPCRRQSLANRTGKSSLAESLALTALRLRAAWRGSIPTANSTLRLPLAVRCRATRSFPAYSSRKMERLLPSAGLMGI